MTLYFATDNFTLIVSAITLAFAIVSCFLNPFVRFKKQDIGVIDDTDESDNESKPAPRLTIILTPHDEADSLEQNLPLLLRQKYPPGFQIIVVIDESAHDTEDVLKRIQGMISDHPGDGSLYFTYIPDSSRYLSRKKLAITVGVKAAATEWLLITETSTKPSSDQWLATMGKGCIEPNHVVIGYGNYSPDTSPFKRFERLHTAHYLMHEDVSSNAYRTLSHNLMFRKSDFMADGGFLGNLNLIRGEYDFIVNKYATAGGTAIVTDDKAWMLDKAPSHKTWLASHILYMETRRWLSGGKRHRLWFNIDQTALHASLLLIIAASFYAIISHNATMLGAAAFALLLTIIVRTVIGYKAMKAFHEKVPALLIYPYEISLVWRNLTYSIRHKLSNKLEFTTHKL